MADAEKPENARDPASDSPEDPPVTAVASRRVRPGREEEFERWVSDILEAANAFPGYLGSEERRRWLREVRPLVREEKVRVLTGLETWFTLPSKPGEPAPPRYKMAAITWLAVFPLVTGIFFLFEPLLNQLPMALRTLVLTVVMVTLMTYVIMPRLTRLFSFWLYPDRD